jgi:predicted nucleic acid-binding protein
MNIVDSSGWLAYFADEPNAGYFLPPLQDTASLVVPTITMYEVCKVVLRESGEHEALEAAVAMRTGKVVDLTSTLSISAAQISLEYGIPMADSIIMATANKYEATIWTQDSDFKHLDKVKYFPKNG